MNPSNSTIARLVYISIVFLVLSIIAIGIHKKAYQAVAPPIYDPISYYSKSQIVWEAISHHQWKSAFNQFPQRPPGTALILYPFGFVPSIHSFLFRSTLAPIVIWALALLVIILPKIRDVKERFAGSALTVGLITMPLFYHFEFPIDSDRAYGISIQWGLVDVLQSSVGALALGLLYTGVRKNLRLMIILAWVVGAYTFFVKPSGILVLCCLFPIYITESIIFWRQRAYNKKYITQIITLFVAGITLMGASVWLAVSSGYLSGDVIKSAQIGAKLLMGIEHQQLFIQLGLIVRPVFGYWWFIVIATTILISLGQLGSSIYKMRFSALGVRFATSLFIISASLYWWVTMAGQEHRYLFPFIMLIMSWLIVPTLFEWMVSLGSRMRYMAIAYCLIPLICLLTLLNIQQGKISSKIEKFFGYNLDAGQYRDEVKMGRSLLQEAVKSEHQITIYSIGNYRVGAVEMIDWINSIENPLESHHFTIDRVNDWIHPGIKIKQLLSCDYFIIENNGMEKLIYPKSALKWQDEEPALMQFIKSCSEQPDSALRMIEDGPVSLYKVQNREKYVAACNDWVANTKWSDDFWVRNSYARGDFEMPGLQIINPNVVDDLLSKTASVLPVIDFGHKMTLLAVLRNAKNNALKGGDDLFTFFFRADEEIPMKYAIFIHLMDQDKKVIFQHDFQIHPYGAAIPAGTYWKSLVQIPERELAKTYSIGFGAYIPNKDGTFLKSNCKESDWNGNRALLPLK
jgi:hypothetical protein